MRSINLRSRRGFTLVELAIVLGVAGLLFAGLWRLIASGNVQAQDAQAASQQNQLMEAVTGYLASNEGQAWMKNISATKTEQLPLPTTNTSLTNCQTVGEAGNPGFCSYLPTGYTEKTSNSYGQNYIIYVLNPTPGTQPTTYSFMILTVGGTPIPDSSGGRISALIGGDGGFLYATTPVCTASPDTLMACGAYGAWSELITDYGIPGNDGVGGQIASRTYVSPTTNSQLIWLDRGYMFGDTTYSFNTMSVPMFMGGQTLYLGKAAGSGPPAAPTGVPATGGTLDLLGGTITGVGLSNITLNGDTTTTNSEITANNGTTCTMTAPYTPNSCPFAIEATTLDVSNLINTSYAYVDILKVNSDRRLKKDIQPLTDNLQDVMRLEPVSFVFKANNQKSLGFIAQEVEKVYPQLVSQGGKGMKAVNYEGLIAPLVGSVQELKKENDILRNQLQVEELRENKLESEVNILSKKK